MKREKHIFEKITIEKKEVKYEEKEKWPFLYKTNDMKNDFFFTKQMIWKTTSL